jgi:hypothetical protein
MREWETSDRLDVFHYGENATRALGWGFMADARRYDAFAVPLQTPTLIYQGPLTMWCRPIRYDAGHRRGRG